MPQPGEPGRPRTGERDLPNFAELDTPRDHFGSDLAHLFDYCRTLLGQDAEAIRTARSVLDSPHEPLPDQETLRAWLFGLARSLAVALRSPGSDQPSYMPPALTAAWSQQTDNGLLRAFCALNDRDREILDLVYRHGIRPADLPAVLIVPAEEVYRCLAMAEQQFISQAAGPDRSRRRPGRHRRAPRSPAESGGWRAPDLPARRVEGAAPPTAGSSAKVCRHGTPATRDQREGSLAVQALGM